MRDRRLVLGALTLVAVSLLAAIIAVTRGAPDATAGSTTPTATPCPIHLAPNPNGDGCIKVTQTPTPTPIPCATDMVYDRYIHACVPITPTPTPCPTDQYPGPLPGMCQYTTALPFPTHTYTPSPTPCPTDMGPDVVHGGCIPITPAPTRCPPDYEIGPKGNCVLGTPPGFPTHTPTPCPTGKVPNTYHGSGCGTPTATPTSVRLPPVFSIEFTVNGEHNKATILVGRLVTIRATYRNKDQRPLRIQDVVEWNVRPDGSRDCYVSPGSGCGGASSFPVSEPGTSKATLHGMASVEACGLCPTVSFEQSVIVHAIALGDFNCNGVMNAVDAALTLQLSAALIQPFGCTGAGDVNEDGYTNAIDAALILQYHAGLITEFP